MGTWEFALYPGSPEGLHTIRVTATDSANNTVYEDGTVTVDDTAPDTFITSGPPAVTNSTTASFTFNGTDNLTDPIQLRFFCRVDGVSIGECTSVPPSDPITLIISGFADGTHTFDVRAVDRAPWVDLTRATHSWLVDTQAPSTTATEVDADFDGLTDSITLNATDPPQAPAVTSSGVRDIMFSGAVSGTVLGDTAVVNLSGVPSGTQVLNFKATDNATNVEVEQHIAFEVDRCPTVAGPVEFQGCPFGDLTNVTIHTVNLGGPASTKDPVPALGAEVRIFDRDNTAFQALWTKNPNGSLYANVYDADVGRVGNCQTADLGIKIPYASCIAGEEFTGNYLVLVRWLDLENGFQVTVGRPKGPADFVDNLATKNIQIIKVYRNGVFQEYRGGSKIVVTGSTLTIIAPDSAIWEGTRSIYPFILTADSDWTVDLCTVVNPGYRIVGYYDANGAFVADQSCTKVMLSNNTVVIGFEAADMGSPEPEFTADITTTHKGKSQKHRVKVNDIRKNTYEAQKQAHKRQR